MKNCLNCNEVIPNRMMIEGKERFLNKRNYCIKCSPFGSHNTKKFHIQKDEKDKIRICIKCGIEYQGGHHKNKNKCGKCYALFYRNKTKQQAIDYKGGKCSVCGYNKCSGAMHFHHVYPNEKKFTIASNSFNKFESLVEELDKCILVCSNCHSEIHADMINKWCKLYEITKPGRGDWNKIKAGLLDKPNI